MVERVRAGVRWGVVNAWDGTGDQIANIGPLQQHHRTEWGGGGFSG